MELLSALGQTRTFSLLVVPQHTLPQNHGGIPPTSGVLIFNACVFIFATADPSLSPALFDPLVSGVQSGTFHSLPPVHSFGAAVPLNPGATCQPKRVLINTRRPRPCDLATPQNGQSPALFSWQGLLEGEGGRAFLSYFLSVFLSSWDTPGCLSASLNDSKCQNHKNQDEVNQKNQEHCQRGVAPACPLQPASVFGGVKSPCNGGTIKDPRKALAGGFRTPDFSPQSSALCMAKFYSREFQGINSLLNNPCTWGSVAPAGPS